MTAAIWYHPDGYRLDQPKLMGRQAAGAGFLTGFARHANTERITAMIERPEYGPAFRETIQASRPDANVDIIHTSRIAALRDVGCLYLPHPVSADQAWIRHLHGETSWSLCGVTHTVCSAGTMDVITGWLSAPLQPWDAIVCTSTAAAEAVRRMIDAQTDFLRRRLGASRFVLPRLPVIPLGVDCESQTIKPDDRAAARAALGIEDDEVVILFVGRLSYHAKANPAPMYLALERLASRHKLVVVECGWTANDHLANDFEKARAQLCPNVRSIQLDGRVPEQRGHAWASADIFCSLSDNIQETFGLTPVEAMAAGLPVVASEWDGYRDTVRDGLDGFLIPTITAPAGSGADLALGHALNVVSYDLYIGAASLATAVDVDATTIALGRLAASPDLRRRMGESGARRAAEMFDWRVIIGAYEALWAELNEMRLAAIERAQGSDRPQPWPARLDPFSAFEHYTPRHLRADTLIRLKAEARSDVFEQRLGLRMASYAPGFPKLDDLKRIRDAVGNDSTTIEALASRVQGLSARAVQRAILLFLKFDLAVVDSRGGMPRRNDIRHAEAR